MAANKTIRIGPVALTTNMATNILNCAVSSLVGPVGFAQTQQYLLVKHIRIINKSANSVAFSLWLGASGANAAGTEIIGSGTTVAANSAYDWFPAGVGLRMDYGDYLVGGANVATSLTLEGEAELGIA